MSMEENGAAAPRRRTSGLTWAFILIGVGVALLLQNMGVVQIDWLYLVHFWPVLLILAGLDFLLGRRSFVGGLLTAALGLAIVAGILWLATGPANLSGWAASLRGNTVTREVQTELGGAEALEVSMNLGAGTTTIDAHEGTTYALQGEYTTDERINLNVAYEVNNGTGDLRLEERGIDELLGGAYVGELDLSLTDALPIDLTVDLGVGESTLDLEQLEITTLDVSTGVGSTDIILGEGSYTADINAGVGEMTIELPENAAVRLELDGGLGSTHFPDRFEKIDDGVWVTPGYSTATDQILLRVNAGIGDLSITE
jgi:hypothetical protein